MLVSGEKWKVSARGSQAWKEKLRAAKLGKSLSQDHKKHISEALYKRILSEETKTKLRANLVLATAAAAKANKGKKLEGERLEKAYRAQVIATIAAAKATKGKKIKGTHLEKLLVSQKLATAVAASVNRGRKFRWPKERVEQYIKTQKYLPGCLAATKVLAKAYRKNPTSIERLAASALKALGIRYQSQKPINCYVADFYLTDFSIDLECDGTYWHSRPGSKEREAERGAFLLQKGIVTVRVDAQHLRENAKEAILSAMEATK